MKIEHDRDAENARRYLGYCHPAPGWRGAVRWYLTPKHAEARIERMSA